MSTAHRERSPAPGPVGPRDATRLFFLHVAKTAGGSFREQLSGIDGIGHLHDIPAVPGDYIRAVVAAKNQRVIAAHGPYRIVEAFGHGVQTITFLREPVGRSISMIDWILQSPSHPEHERVRAMRGDIEGFLIDPALQAQVRDVQTAWLGSTVDVAEVVDRYRRGEIDEHRAWEEVWGPTGTPCFQLNLELAKARLSAMPFVGITELYRPSLRLFATTFGLPEPRREARSNVASDREGRGSRYPQRERALLASVNLWDSPLYEFGRRMFVERYRRAFGEDPT